MSMLCKLTSVLHLSIAHTYLLMATPYSLRFNKTPIHPYYYRHGHIAHGPIGVSMLLPTFSPGQVVPALHTIADKPTN